MGSKELAKYNGWINSDGHCPKLAEDLGLECSSSQTGSLEPKLSPAVHCQPVLGLLRNL
jgi:hypothetical protein